MKISSPNFTNGQIPDKYSCDGEDVNPALEVNEIPDQAKSLALIVDDPDAPAGDWVHWLVWNIQPNINRIEENSVPEGAIQGMTDFGYAGWGGPCPPSGTHSYHFKLYALDSLLELLPASDKADLEKSMQGHILEQAELVATYTRT